ncbi:MAG: uroporphyrinogen decarboxylase family protein, partial [Methanococcaceae archaeon]
LNTLEKVIETASGLVSIHSEVFSPWSQFLELFNYESALLAIMLDPGKVKACLNRLTEGTVELAKMQAKIKPDAILIPSAFAGAGFISHEHYTEFVAP